MSADSAVRVAGRSPVRRVMSTVANDSLYRNSTFLMANSVLVAGLGFLFWTIAARAFPATAVGTTTTVISAVTYAAMMGTLGLPNTVIRFLSSADDPVRLLTACGAVAAGGGALAGLLWCLVPGHFGMPLDDVTSGRTAIPMVVTVVALGSVGAIAEAAIIALRTSKWVVVENGIGSLVKLLAMPLAVGLGALGLFGLFFASVLASTLTSIAVVVRLVGGPRRRWFGGVDLGSIRHARSFAAGNYLAALMSMLPGTVIRIVVLVELGAQAAAYLAIPLMIVALLKVIPATASQSLFAEASAAEASLVEQAKRTVRGIYVVLLPAIVLLVVLARPILTIFGSDYAAEGTRCLQLLALSCGVSGLSYVADTMLNAWRRIGDYVFLNVAGSLFAIGLPVAFVGHGLTGVGFGWLLGQMAYCLLAIATVGRRRRVTPALQPNERRPS